MLILDLWGISFHPAVVIGLGNDLLFNSILAHCDSQLCVSQHLQFEITKEFTKNSQRNPKELLKNSRKILKSEPSNYTSPKNSNRIPKNSKRIPKEFQKNSKRIP